MNTQANSGDSYESEVALSSAAAVRTDGPKRDQNLLQRISQNATLILGLAGAASLSAAATGCGGGGGSKGGGIAPTTSSSVVQQKIGINSTASTPFVFETNAGTKSSVSLTGLSDADPFTLKIGGNINTSAKLAGGILSFDTPNLLPGDYTAEVESNGQKITFTITILPENPLFNSIVNANPANPLLETGGGIVNLQGDNFVAGQTTLILRTGTGVTFIPVTVTTKTTGTVTLPRVAEGIYTPSIKNRDNGTEITTTSSITIVRVNDVVPPPAVPPVDSGFELHNTTLGPVTVSGRTLSFNPVSGLDGQGKVILSALIQVIPVDAGGVEGAPFNINLATADFTSETLKTVTLPLVTGVKYRIRGTITYTDGTTKDLASGALPTGGRREIEGNSDASVPAGLVNIGGEDDLRPKRQP